MAEPRDVAERDRGRLLRRLNDHLVNRDLDGGGCYNMTLTHAEWAIVLAALRSPGLDRDGERMREAAERGCHEEQMTVWTSEVADSLSMGGYLRDDTTYEDVLHIHAILAREIRSIVESAFSHPGLSALPLAHEEKAGC